MTIGVRENAPAFAASLLLAAGVKAAYPHLGPDDLRFMTAPTQALVALLSGVDFTYEAGYGYVNFPHLLVIAKSCTGVNFLLAVFGLLAFTLVPSVSRPGTKLLLVGASAGCAFGVTVIVNALRIALGVALHEGGVAWGWLDAGRMHRLAGIVVYFLSLVGVHVLGRHVVRLAQGHAGAASPLLLAPLLSYGLVTVGLPLANGAFAGRTHLFLEHCAWVAGVTLALSGCIAWRARR